MVQPGPALPRPSEQWSLPRASSLNSSPTLAGARSSPAGESRVTGRAAFSPIRFPLPLCPPFPALFTFESRCAPVSSPAHIPLPPPAPKRLAAAVRTRGRTRRSSRRARAPRARAPPLSPPGVGGARAVARLRRGGGGVARSSLRAGGGSGGPGARPRSARPQPRCPFTALPRPSPPAPLPLAASPLGREATSACGIRDAAAPQVRERGKERASGEHSLPLPPQRLPAAPGAEPRRSLLHFSRRSQTAPSQDGLHAKRRGQGGGGEEQDDRQEPAGGRREGGQGSQAAPLR